MKRPPPSPDAYWVRLTAGGLARWETLRQQASDGTMPEADCTFWFGLCDDFIDWHEWWQRNPAYGDKTVRRHAKARRKALAEAQKRWVKQSLAAWRQETRDREIAARYEMD